MERKQRHASLGQAIAAVRWRTAQAQRRRQRRQSCAGAVLSRLRATTAVTRQASVAQHGRALRRTEANVGIQHDEDVGQAWRRLARPRGAPRQKDVAEACVVQRQLSTCMGLTWPRSVCGRTAVSFSTDKHFSHAHHLPEFTREQGAMPNTHVSLHVSILYCIVREIVSSKTLIFAAQ